MFRKHGRPTASILTVKQIAVVRERARVAATRLKLPPGQAELIADTIIAELAGSQG
jgi:hypothetical protein